MIISDQKERIEALNPMQSYLVKAPAGSGKTTLIISRIEQLLNMAHASQITALTFTRNSAQEMRHRLNEKNPQASEVNIATYDAWIARLLKKISPQRTPPVTQSPHALYQMAWQRAFNHAQADPHHPLTQVLSHHWQLFPLLKNTCINMLGKRDQWLPFMFENHATWVTSQWQMMLNHCADDLIALMGHHWDPFQQLFIHCQADQVTLTERSIEQLTQMAQWLLTKTGSVRKPSQKMGFEPKASAKNPALAHMKKEQFHLITEHIQHNQKLLRLWQIFQQVQSQQTPAFLNQMTQFLPELIAHLKLIFQEHNEVDYCENALNLLNILQSKSAHDHPELRHTQHLLLDEFQDTSPLQYAILGAFIDEWSNDKQSSLFLVGDPMQSIYGFRNADVRLILDIEKRQKFHHLPIKTLHLKTNFRSNQHLIAFQNQVFSHMMSTHMDINWCDIVFKPSVGLGPSNPSVHHHDCLPDDKFKAIIASLESIPAHQTIGILTPTRKSGLDILSHLKRHTDFIIQDTGLRRQSEQPLLHDTLVLFHAICHPSCNLTWSALSQTPWIKLSLTQLQIFREDKKKPLFEHVCQHPDAGYIHQVSRLIKTSLSTHDPFQTLIFVLNHINPLIVYHPDLQSLLCALEKTMPFEHLSELMAWANQIDHPQETSSERICITTMHQSKGLEYDHVILPFLNHSSPPAKPDIISIDSWLSDHHPLPITLMASPIDATHHQSILSLLQKHKIQQEKKRLLYVALTRAKLGLHLYFEPTSRKNTAQDWLSPYF
ncbi:UvrD-helicase domain-containing protein [Gammaproteobacteria bacterium]|nr:UvrD-helicase domain-containing protein [Gammaproteobacteria bacterium]